LTSPCAAAFYAAGDMGSEAMFDIKGKVVAVTGAASGIGRALAEEAARRGAKVAIADLDHPRAISVAQEIAAGGAVAHGFHVDVTSLDSVQALVSDVVGRFGGVNVAFNNAGVFTGGTLERTKPADFDWVFEVNVRGMFNGITGFLPALRRSAEAGQLAHMINTGSENSIGVPTVGPFSAYTATKHAVLGLTDSLRRDLEGSGIGVSLVCPGMVRTELWNAKRARPERYGGARLAPAEAAASMSEGRTARETAETAFAGLEAGEFLIITDSRIRGFAQKRLEDIARALDVCDARVGPL
jgi:NAD(P)-dependent dehydrogenase (short-subunit alcohol dehydrogenase family)